MPRSEVVLLGVIVMLVAAACGGSEHREAVTVTPESMPQAVASSPPQPQPEPTTTTTAEPSAPTPTTSSASDVTVARDVWVDAFTNALPVALCKDASYFRSCFPVTPAECEQVAASATRVCIGSVRKQLPAKLHQPDEGTAWGRKIGGCVGTSYEATLAQRKIKSPKCDDPSAWTP